MAAIILIQNQKYKIYSYLSISNYIASVKYVLLFLLLAFKSINLFAGFFETLAKKMENKDFNQVVSFFDSSKNQIQDFHFNFNLNRNILPEYFDSRIRFSFISKDSVNLKEHYESFSLDIIRHQNQIIFYKINPLINQGISSSKDFNSYSSLLIGKTDEIKMDVLKKSYQLQFKDSFNLNDLYTSKIFFGLDCMTSQSVLSPAYVDSFAIKPDYDLLNKYFAHPLFEYKIIALYLTHKILKTGLILRNDISAYYSYILNYKGNIQICSSGGANIIDFEIFKSTYLN